MQHELNLSYDDIINFFYNHSVQNSFLIIEYIDVEDERYKLIRNPNYPFKEGVEAFTEALESKYNIIKRNKPISTRELFLAKKK